MSEENTTTDVVEKPATGATPAEQGASAEGAGVKPAASGAASQESGGSTGTDAGNGGNDAGAGELQAFREKLAGGDEAMLKQLGRFKSVEAISRAFREASQIAKNTGKQAAKLTDKSTPEEVKAYREAMGIPDDPSAYPVNFRQDFEASEFDTAALSSFKEHMHESSADPRAAAAAIEWFQDFALAQRQELDATLAKTAKATQAALRNEWGGEYDGNLNAAQQIMTAQLGEEGFERMMGLRLMDGSRLQDDPAFVKMMAQIGADYYGGNAIVTGDVETTSKTVEERINELMQLRATDSKKYFSDEVQGKLTKLYAQRDKLRARK